MRNILLVRSYLWGGVSALVLAIGLLSVPATQRSGVYVGMATVQPLAMPLALNLVLAIGVSFIKPRGKRQPITETTINVPFTTPRDSKFC